MNSKSSTVAASSVTKPAGKADAGGRSSTLSVNSNLNKTARSSGGFLKNSNNQAVASANSLDGLDTIGEMDILSP